MKVVVTGAHGQLGVELVTAFGQYAHHQVIAVGRGDLDIEDRDAVLGAVGSWRPDLIVNAAAWTAVDACEADPDRAFRVNALGARHVAEAARRFGAHLLHTSTDYVFDGTRPVASGGYSPWDVTQPRSVYGRSKLAGEQEVLAGCPGAAVVRTSWVFGRHGHNLVRTIVRLLGEGRPLAFVDDQHGCPTYTGDLAATIYQLAVGRLPGVWHVTNATPTTWYGLARDVIAAAGADPDTVRPIATTALVPARPAERPTNSILDNSALLAVGIQPPGPYGRGLELTVAHLLGSAS